MISLIPLTEKLLQLHNGRVGSDAMDSLHLLRIPGLEHLTIRSIGIVLVRHIVNLFVEIGLLIEATGWREGELFRATDPRYLAG
jgi:hypothetical protein